MASEGSVYPVTVQLRKDMSDFLAKHDSIGSPEYRDAQIRAYKFCSYLHAYEHGEADVDDLGLTKITQLSDVLFDLFLFMENHDNG